MFPRGVGGWGVLYLMGSTFKGFPFFNCLQEDANNKWMGLSKVFFSCRNVAFLHLTLDVAFATNASTRSSKKKELFQ